MTANSTATDTDTETDTAPIAAPLSQEDRLRRWRMVLGSEAATHCGALTGRAAELDQALAALYEADGPGGLQARERRGGRGGSSPSVARWLGDIRKYFPSSVVQVLQRDASEQRGNLILSFYSGAVYRLLPLIVARARQRLPGIQLRIEEMTARQTFAALEDGRIDMGLLRPIIIPDTCVGQAVYSEKLVVALPFDHPLARQTKLSLARLQGEPFIMYRDDAPYMNKLLTDLFQRHGFTPDIVQSHSQAHAILSLVSANLGVALLPEDVREANYRNVVLRPLVNDDGLAVEAHAVRLKRNQNPVLTPMLDLLSTLHAAAAPFG